MARKEDYYTNSVDGAEGFENYYDDRNFYNEEENEDEEEYDTCRCSDPGCPCSGVKRGGL